MPLPLVTRVARLLSFLLAATSGVGLFYQVLRVLFQKMRWWIWNSIVRNHSRDMDEAVAMPALAAVKAASSVATEVAKLSQVMLGIQSEGRLRAMNIVRALQAQQLKLTEIEGTTRGIVEEMHRRKQPSATNGENAKALHSSTANNTAQSPTFLEVMAMLERGETPPGIKNINDKPPVPNQRPSLSCLPPKPKVSGILLKLI
ncbi:hypothetical protein GOP47_0001924 [Adiantum capillus-veneris]|uniref:Peroxisomal membrane protein PEX14 n=1 Tax=Adiantum capillus-veneris TaxID=13818 RepID=A0A9D4ZQI1_ADICA|nr:hypothetical protein GOP47_0001924 [Adiantum capillus-veneris]